MEEYNYPQPQSLSREDIVSNIEKIKKDIETVRLSVVDEFHEVIDELDGKKQIEKDEGDDTMDVEKKETTEDKLKENTTDTENKSSNENSEEQVEEKPNEDAKPKPGFDIWRPPPRSIPIHADVRNFNFAKLAEEQKRITGRKFDVIMTDPPWQLATSNPTRGVAIGYQQLGDSIINEIPIPKLQDNGFIFIWVINAKYRFALNLMESWGYELVDEVVWVKQTVNRRLAKSHGFYLQHAKETCLVGKKGNDPPGMIGNKLKDVIFAERRGQSQKPVEIYEMIEQFVPNGTYLEIFGRRNNLRDYWCTIGNEL